MTYKAWAKEYYDCAMDMKNRLELVREELKSAVEPRRSELAVRLRIMYEMYRDCMQTADLLARRRGEC